MALVNENYLKLQGSYLFAEIAHRVQKFKAENPEAKMKDWMTYLRDNFFRRYDGKKASAVFNQK